MPPSLDPALRDGLRRQEDANAKLLASGAQRLGWKAGFGTRAAMEMLGTSGPLAALLTDSTLRPSGASLDVSGWAKPVLETEVAVRLGADLGAGESRSEIEAAVAGVGAAIELVDLGAAGTEAGEILAAGIFHRATLLGELAPLPADTALADLRIDVRAGGQEYARAADPAALVGDLVEVLAGLADLLDQSEDGLRAGDVIITGAAAKPLELHGGEQVEARVGDSTVSARIA